MGHFESRMRTVELLLGGIAFILDLRYALSHNVPKTLSNLPNSLFGETVLLRGVLKARRSMPLGYIVARTHTYTVSDPDSPEVVLTATARDKCSRANLASRQHNWPLYCSISLLLRAG